MSTVPARMLSSQEYLARERLAEYRSEFYHGETFAMSGDSPRHSLIGTNALRELSSSLKRRPCTAYNSDLRILIAASGLYTYPDVSVICGALEYADEYRDTILNPTLLAEVLSTSTEAYDRGKKFEHYRKIPALREYLLISQDRPTVERFARNLDDAWMLTSVNGLEQIIELTAIGVSLSLAELYDKVDFTFPSTPTR